MQLVVIQEEEEHELGGRGARRERFGRADVDASSFAAGPTRSGSSSCSRCIVSKRARDRHRRLRGGRLPGLVLAGRCRARHESWCTDLRARFDRDHATRARGDHRARRFAPSRSMPSSTRSSSAASMITRCRRAPVPRTRGSGRCPSRGAWSPERSRRDPSERAEWSSTPVTARRVLLSVTAGVSLPEEERRNRRAPRARRGRHRRDREVHLAQCPQRTPVLFGAALLHFSRARPTCRVPA